MCFGGGELAARFDDAHKRVVESTGTGRWRGCQPYHVPGGRQPNLIVGAPAVASGKASVALKSSTYRDHVRVESSVSSSHCAGTA
jgi:hypothetical protein